MLSILAGSLALGFVYAPPAFAEKYVTIEHGADDENGGTYNLDAVGTNNGTNYGDEKGYTSISLPTGPIDKFTVIAGDGGETIVNGSTDGKGGSISLSAIGNIINNGISVTAGNGGKSYYHSKDENVTGGAGGDVTLTFTNVVNGNITASAGNGGNIEPYINGNLTSGDGGDGGDVKLAFTNVVNGNIDASAGNGGTIYASNSSGNAIGGNGGNVTLTFNDVVVTDSISLTSGMNGTGNGANSTPGNGGSVNFTAESISGTQSTDNINITLNKNDGDITFDVGTLNIDDNTVKITVEDNSSNSNNNGENNIVIAKTGQNHIDNLILTGSGDFKTVDENGDKIDDITVGRLTIDGVTIISDSSTGNAWTNIIRREYSNNTITIGTKGATFNIVDSYRTNILTKSVTGAGNLTKTGTGTLILGKENENYTYDYAKITLTITRD